MFASLAAMFDGGLLTLIRSRSNQPSATQLSAWVSVGDVSLCNAAAMWIVERLITFSPLIAPKMADSDALVCYIFGPWR
jgi:hypothetical protein